MKKIIIIINAIQKRKRDAHWTASEEGDIYRERKRNQEKEKKKWEHILLIPIKCTFFIDIATE